MITRDGHASLWHGHLVRLAYRRKYVRSLVCTKYEASTYRCRADWRHLHRITYARPLPFRLRPVVKSWCSSDAAEGGGVERFASHGRRAIRGVASSMTHTVHNREIPQRSRSHGLPAQPVAIGASRSHNFSLHILHTLHEIHRFPGGPISSDRLDEDFSAT